MEKEILGKRVRIFPTCKPSGYIGFDIFEINNIDCNNVEEALIKGEEFYLKNMENV